MVRCLVKYSFKIYFKNYNSLLYFFIILVIFINFFRIEKFKKFEILEADKKKLFYLFLILTISNIIFFIKFPLYRYGYSYLVTLLIILFSLFISRTDSKFLNKLFKFITIICLTIFCLKQFINIEKNYVKRDIWPNIYSFLPKNLDTIPNKIKIKDSFYLFQKSKECLYNKSGYSPCTNYSIVKLKHKKILNYDIIFFQE